jgi:hypothetical protein
MVCIPAVFFQERIELGADLDGFRKSIFPILRLILHAQFLEFLFNNRKGLDEPLHIPLLENGFGGFLGDGKAWNHQQDDQY